MGGDASGSATVQSSNTFFVINPSKDLPATQDRLEPMCRDKSNAGWDGLVR